MMIASTPASNKAFARSNVSLVTPTAAATSNRPCSSFAAFGNSINAEKILQKHKIEKLPIVDNEGRLSGLITIKDIEKVIEFPNAAKDEHGRIYPCF